MVEAVAKAYKDANAYLIGKGVMPEIDLKSFVRRTGGAGSGSACRWVAAMRGALARRTGMATGTQHLHAGRGGGGRHATRRLARGRPLGGSAAGGNGPGATRAARRLLMARQRAQGVLLNLKRFVTARIGGDILAASAGPAGQGGHGRRTVAALACRQAFAAAIADAEVAYQAAVVPVRGRRNEATPIQHTCGRTAPPHQRTQEEVRRPPPTRPRSRSWR